NRIWHFGGRQFQSGRDMTCYLGSPDIDYAKTAEAFGVEGEVVKEPDKLKGALERAKRATADGRPYLLDVHTYRDGIGAARTGIRPTPSPICASARCDHATACALFRRVSLAFPQRRPASRADGDELAAGRRPRSRRDRLLAVPHLERHHGGARRAG